MKETTIFNYEGLEVEKLTGSVEEIVLNCPYNLTEDEKEYVLSSYSAGYYRYCLEFVYKKSIAVLKKALYSAGETIASKLAYTMDEASLLGIADIFALGLATKFNIIDKEDRLDMIKLAELLQAKNRRLSDSQITKEQASSYVSSCFNYIFYKDYSNFEKSFVDLIDLLTQSKLIPLSPEYITMVGAPSTEKIILVRLLFVLLFEIKKREEIFINNFKLLIPVLWDSINMSDKIYLSLYLKQNNNTELAEQVIEEVNKHIKIPDFNTNINLIVNIFSNGQDALASHFSLNNTRSEISALLNIKEDLHIPAMFTRYYMCPTILAYLGNPYGELAEARNVAKDILNDISNDKWVYFFKNYFLDNNILVKLFYSQKTASAWCELVQEYIEDIEEEITNEDIKNVIILSKQGDVENVRKICKALYFK